MEFLQNHWGGLASVLGLLISLIGLAWAILEARGAKSAARAANRATLETRERIGRHLVIVDLERSVALIQRLKLLHDTGRWEGALEQYQALREMLSSIVVRYPEPEPDRRQRLILARNQVTVMEEQVRSLQIEGSSSQTQTRLNLQPNQIQSDLEDLANAIGLGDERGED